MHTRYYTATGYLYQIKRLILALMQLYFINLMTRYTFIILGSSSFHRVRGLKITYFDRTDTKKSQDIKHKGPRQ